MKLVVVHWPLIGGLLHLVQRWGDWAGPQPAQAPPRCTKCNSPPINGQCTNHHYCIIRRLITTESEAQYNGPLLCGFNVGIKGLIQCRLGTICNIYIFIHHNMIERTEQRVQQKSTHTKEKNNNRTSYPNLHITFSHDRYFATNFLIRFSTTVLGRSNSNCARQ